MHSGALSGTRLQAGCYRPKSQWSIQSVKGKITGKCLWHAIKALLVGIFLIVIGAAMATVGYYADVLSMEEEIQGNVTVKVKNISKGFHLTNLSYFGPIIMGCGGFVIVAACVMTFEARDSASKIVPTRFRNKRANVDGGSTATLRPDEGGESWEIGASASLYPTACARGMCGSGLDRHALTTAFIQFSKNLQKSIDSRDLLLQSPQTQKIQNSSITLLKRFPSAPTLIPTTSASEQTLDNIIINNNDYNKPLDHQHHQPPINGVRHPQHCVLLNPNIKRLQVNYLLPRQAISVDNPSSSAELYESHFSSHHNFCSNSGNDMADDAQQQDSSSSDVDKTTDSLGSMTMDLHFPDCSVTLTVKDESKNPKNGGGGDDDASGSSTVSTTPSSAGSSSLGDVGRKETSKRRPLMRQQQIDHGDSDSEFDVPGESPLKS